MTPEVLRAELPDDLPQRVHRIRPPGPEGSPPPFLTTKGDFVLYWMRTSVRAHENPALDVALHLADRLDRPLFVYHALSERYPYASDRHHRFILEGARDVQAEFGERGIGYAFHLERPGHRGPHLVTLADSAAAIVTEDFPTRPLDGWTHALAERVGRELWAVDAACLCPMRSVDAGATTRAYRFRKAAKGSQRSRLNSPAREVEPRHDAFVPDLPFEPLQLAGADLASLIAECEIDHGVGPIAHTPGGSRAGYARWNRFRERGLGAYARTRNGALKGGVSRMSAYLHYGHVSPFRIAREAQQVGGKGAEKYLDELLVWRELAWAYCAAYPDHDTVDTLPGWARETLRAHAEDPRELLSWERLARGKTGDPIWDAAQWSLHRNGELHNNVRMTWGKALLGWTPDPETALDRLIDLNHRYALDGRDPASYGGLLWCLGGFDRPFDPEKPILGTVRPRDTAHHARRLDPEEYGARTARPAWREAPSVAIIGAGLSGLMAGRILADHGWEVTLLDKGRRPGGRMNTREHEEHRFDHGAQYFTIRDPRLARHLESWAQEGVVAEWTPRVIRSTAEGIEEGKASTRWVGTPGMIDLPLHLAEDLDVRCGVRVEEIRDAGEDGLLLLDGDGGELGRWDRVIVTAPAPQTVPLLEPVAPGIATAAREIEMAPCWSVMLAFSEELAVDFDAAFVTDSPLTWVARDSSKPGRSPDDGTADRWVLHGSPEWTREHLEAERDDVVAALMAAFEERFGLQLPKPTFTRAHRWGYALAAGPVDGLSLYDSEAGVVACGDWCAGGRVEGALLSGMSAAGRLLREAPTTPGDPLSEPARDPSGQLGLLD